ncbi:MAG: GDYXXLXY domain-containing protein [Reyranella sp.]|uniref:GDYXXLXY domain-containing protein n=1 Tax=Reyranella sp. TaxID=1929291 RepID=UPI003D0C0D71
MRHKAAALLVIAALALPLVALAAMIGQQEWLRSHATVLTVAVRGVDPRDLLRGHYLTAAFEWSWESPPGTDGRMVAGALCVIAVDAQQRARVRFVPDSTGDQPTLGSCRLIIPGRLWGKDTFVPATIDTANGSIKLFVPEARAGELERLIRERPGALTVDLAVRADGHVSIQALHIDGQVLGR